MGFFRFRFGPPPFQGGARGGYESAAERVSKHVFCVNPQQHGSCQDLLTKSPFRDIFGRSQMVRKAGFGWRGGKVEGFKTFPPQHLTTYLHVLKRFDGHVATPPPCCDDDHRTTSVHGRIVAYR